MSGPKVVNIQAIRRQQRRECAALLRELTAAMEQCVRLHNKNQGSDANLKLQTESVLGHLQALRDAENWAELRTQTQAQRDFYQNTADDMRRQFIEHQAAQLRREHRLRQSARQMREELRRVPKSPERETALRQLDSAEDAASLQLAIENTVSLVSSLKRDTEAIEATERLRELAAAYLDPDTEQDTQFVRPTAEPDVDEVRLERCFALLGELESAVHESEIQKWKTKAIMVEQLTGDERTMRLDSLVLELSAYLQNKKEMEAAVKNAHSVLSAMESVSSREAAIWRDRLSAALREPFDLKHLTSLTNEARSWMEKEIQQDDAAEQRLAILKALTSLGYEVREGMVTAWAEDGRVVVQKPQETVYGVELSAPAAGSAFQVRVIAKGDLSRSKQRDLEVEQTWCSEFARLQALLGESGFATELKLAHVPGAVPIKTVGDAARDARRDATERSTLNRRTL